MFTHFVLHMKVQCTSNVLVSFYIVDIWYVHEIKNNNTRRDRTRAKERVYSFVQLDKYDYECNGDTEQQNRGKCLPESYRESTSEMKEKKRNQKKNNATNTHSRNDRE